MKTTLLASGLGFPEGPVTVSDGRVVLCDGNTGELLVYADGSVSAYARIGGSPWGMVLGSDGAMYVTQGGNVPGSDEISAVPGIQRVLPDGAVELLFSEVAGYPLYGPNVLAFGPDGRLWFTESGVRAGFPLRCPLAWQALRRQPVRRGRRPGPIRHRGGDAARATRCLPERDRLRRAAATVLDRVDGPSGAAGRDPTPPAWT